MTDSSSFRVFFQSACDVPELEEKFNIDEYSDMVTLSKPVIYISIEEIINTHSVNSNTFTAHLNFFFFCLFFQNKWRFLLHHNSLQSQTRQYLRLYRRTDHVCLCSCFWNIWMPFHLNQTTCYMSCCRIWEMCPIERHCLVLSQNSPVFIKRKKKWQQCF